MVDPKYTKDDIVKAIVGITGTPCNPRNREQAWIVLSRICSERGIANPLATADEPKPEDSLSTVTDDIGVIDSDQIDVEDLIEFADDRIAFHESVNAVAPDVAVINDTWVGQHGHERFAKVEDEEPKVVLVDPKGKRHRVGTREFEAIQMLSAGTTQGNLAKRFGWEPHTARGLIHGAIKRRYGFTVSATKHGKGKGSYTLYKINEPVNTVPA